MTWDAVHVQFTIRKLVFMIIPIAREGSITVQNKQGTHEQLSQKKQLWLQNSIQVRTQ